METQQQPAELRYWTLLPCPFALNLAGYLHAQVAVADATVMIPAIFGDVALLSPIALACLLLAVFVSLVHHCWPAALQLPQHVPACCWPAL